MSNILNLMKLLEQDTSNNSFLQDIIKHGDTLLMDPGVIEFVHNSITSTINNRLNKAATRYKGLLQLNIYVTKCSSNMLLQYGMLWLGKATKELESIHNNPEKFPLTCNVIGNVIIQCTPIPELQQQISMENVKQLINILSSLKSFIDCPPTYYLLATLLYYYPEACERSLELIRRMILSQIDSTNGNLVSAVARCFALLIRATKHPFKPPPTKSYYTFWTYNQTLICNNLHEIMDKLYCDFLETKSLYICDKLDLLDIPEDNTFRYYSKQQQRFCNLCVYLSAMLNVHGEGNSVLPNTILRVLCRGLAINPTYLRNGNSIKRQLLYFIMPKLCISLFNVLSALINGFKKELLPYGSVILKLFNQTIKWTANELTDQKTLNACKPFKNIKLSVYKCLSLWLLSNTEQSGIETIIHECLPFILKDVISERVHSSALFIDMISNDFSKKALKRMRNGQYIMSPLLKKGLAVKENIRLDADLCCEALITLQNIIFNSYVIPSIYDGIQRIVIPLLYDYYFNTPILTFYKQNAQCRLQLLKLLKGLRLNIGESSAPAMAYAIEIFEMAHDDVNPQIVQEAKCALSGLEKIIHPSAPTLCLPKTKEFIEEDEIRSNELNDEESVSNNEDILPPTKKRPKILDIVTFISDEKNHTDSGNNNTDKVTDKSMTVESSKSEDYLLEESKSIVNRVPLIKVKDIEQNAESEQQNSTKEDLIISDSSDEIINKQLEQTEVKSIKMYDAEEDLKEDNPEQEDNLKTVEEMDDIITDNERQMLLTFQDLLKDD